MVAVDRLVYRHERTLQQMQHCLAWFQRLPAVVYEEALAELSRQEERVLNFIADVGSTEVVVEAAEVIFDLLFGVAPALFGLLLDEALVEGSHLEWFDVGAELLQLDEFGLACRLTTIYEYGRGNAAQQNFGGLSLALTLVVDRE